MMNRRVRRGDNIMHIVNIRLRRMWPRFGVSLILVIFFGLTIGRDRTWIGRFRRFPRRRRRWERQIMKVITRPFSFLRFCCCKLLIVRFCRLFFHVIFRFSLNSFSNCFKLINLKYNCYIRSVLLLYINCLKYTFSVVSMWVFLGWIVIGWS